MKIYMIYSKDLEGYITQSRLTHDRVACFSTLEKAVEFLKNVYEKGLSNFYGKINNTVIFIDLHDKNIKYTYEIEEVKLDDFY